MKWLGRPIGLWVVFFLVMVIVLSIDAMRNRRRRRAEWRALERERKKASSTREMNSEVLALARGNSEFALQLYHQLAAGQGNLFLSPFSVSTALAMAYGGAAGETARELSATLRFPLTGPQLHSSFAALLKLAEGGEERDYQLSIANGLWAQRGSGFKDEFVSLVKANYAAGLRELDFAAAGDSRQAINRWVEQQTRDKIRELIPPAGITDLTRLILANAIYFRGRWMAPFEKRATKDAPFHVTPERQVTVPMMFQQMYFAYLETRSFQAVRLPYMSGDLSMIVLLPRQADGLGEFEASLTAERLDHWVGELTSREVKVYLPRFRVESSFTLNDSLAAMGMRRVFDLASADFSGMTDSRDLFISLVVHKAFADVDEYGTEATAASAIGMPLGAPPPERPVVFRADHPFLFFILERLSGSVLFLGRVTNPLL